MVQSNNWKECQRVRSTDHSVKLFYMNNTILICSGGDGSSNSSSSIIISSSSFQLIKILALLLSGFKWPTHFKINCCQFNRVNEKNVFIKCCPLKIILVEFSLFLFQFNDFYS